MRNTLKSAARLALTIVLRGGRVETAVDAVVYWPVHSIGFVVVSNNLQQISLKYINSFQFNIKLT